MFDLIPMRNKKSWFPSIFDNDDEGSIFDRFFSDFSQMFGDGFYTDEKGNSIFEIEVPGFNKDNLKVDIADGILTIKGERKLKNACCAGQTKVYKRISVGDMKDANADLKDGILTITLKGPEPKKVKKIDIK